MHEEAAAEAMEAARAGGKQGQQAVLDAMEKAERAHDQRKGSSDTIMQEGQTNTRHDFMLAAWSLSLMPCRAATPETKSSNEH